MMVFSMVLFCMFVMYCHATHSLTFSFDGSRRFIRAEISLWQMHCYKKEKKEWTFFTLHVLHKRRKMIFMINITNLHFYECCMAATIFFYLFLEEEPAHITSLSLWTCHARRGPGRRRRGSHIKQQQQQQLGKATTGGEREEKRKLNDHHGWWWWWFVFNDGDDDDSVSKVGE